MKPARGILRILLALAAVALACAAGVAGLDRGLGALAYDAIAGFREETESSRAILLLPIDQEAIEEIGTFPWKRSSVAEGISVLSEMDARLVLLDLPFGEVSEPDLAPSSNAARLAASFDLEFSGIKENIVAFYDALRLGSLDGESAPRVLGELLGLVDQGQDRLLGAVLGTETIDEAALGRESAANGKVFFSLEPLDSGSIRGRAVAGSTELAAIALRPIAAASPPYLRLTLAAPDSAPLARTARGGGFREPGLRSSGGSRPSSLGRAPDRSALLIAQAGGMLVGSAAFAALHDYLGSPSITLLPGAIRLKGARFPGTAPRDISIPLSEERRLLFTRSPSAKSAGGSGAATGAAGSAASSFRSLSWAELARYARFDDELAAALDRVALAGRDGGEGRAAAAASQRGYAAALRAELGSAPAGEAERRLRDWREERERYFILAADAVGGDAEAKALAKADAAIATGELPAEKLRTQVLRRDAAAEAFAAARRALDAAMGQRARLKRELADSFCVVSIAERADGAGRAACAADAILSGSAMLPLPRILGIAIGAIAGIIAAFAGSRMGRIACAAACVIWLAIVAGACAGLFLAGDAWLDPVVAGLAPVAALAVSAISAPSSPRPAR